MDTLQLWHGHVMHARLRPVINRFVYRVFWLRIRMDQPPAGNWLFGINVWRPLSINWRDYGRRNGSDPLQWVRETLASQGIDAGGAIWLQTFPRQWGYAFNPVSFWLCHDAAGALRAVLAEVNNTFGDWHTYVLTAPDGGSITAGTQPRCRKLMHVSPFNPMTGHYTFRLNEKNDQSRVAIDYDDGQGCLLKTAISGWQRPATTRTLLQAMVSHPLLTLGVIVRIHWQAWHLWRARLPFYRQPQKHQGGVSCTDPGLENRP